MLAELASRKRVLPALSYFLGLTGLFVAATMGLKLLNESVHALGHTEHLLSVPAQILGDGTAVPFNAGLYLTVTLALLFLPEPLVSRSPASKAFLHVSPLVMVAFLGLYFVLGACLRVTDIQYIPWPVHLPDPFLFANTISLILSAGGILLLLLYTWRPHSLWLYAYAALPCCGAIFVTLSFPAQWAAELFGLDESDMAPGYPRILWVSLAVAALIAAGAALQRLWSRIGAARDDPQIGPFVAGTWAWAVFFFVALQALSPYDHLCYIHAHVPIQEKANRLIRLAFLGLWAIIVAVQLARYWRGRSRRQQIR